MESGDLPTTSSTPSLKNEPNAAAECKKDRVLYKVVLTGGPCAGKTTTLARLRTFFENLGWKVYTVPEAATILLNGIQFEKLSPLQADIFQLNILKTILQLERTYFELAEEDKKNVLIVCDRGVMDPSAFCTDEAWSAMIGKLGYDSVQLRDSRYDQVVHMVTAASGAEQFYQVSNNPSRSEGLALARERDRKAAQAWVGHPYYDVVDNSTNFENKIKRVIALICKRIGKLGAQIDDRLKAQSKKRKFLVKKLPPLESFPRFQDFDVQHDFLVSTSPYMQIRLRKRGQKGRFAYTLTERRTVADQNVEQIRQLRRREYDTLYLQRDHDHCSIHKNRRCFLYQDHYFQLDIFREPWSNKCEDLILLETYTTEQGDGLQLPDFLDVLQEVTDDPRYSMFNLSSIK